MAGSNARLVVGAGNSFNFSGSHAMSELLQTDTAALLFYSCDSVGGCQLRTSEVRYPDSSPSSNPNPVPSPSSNPDPSQVAAPSSTCLAGSAGADGVCQLCSPGTYTDLDDQAECRNCSGGFYQQLAGQTACVACPLGHACPNGSAAALECAARYLNLTLKRTRTRTRTLTLMRTRTRTRTLSLTLTLTLTRCAAGSFADVTGLTECNPCEDGRYCAPGLNPNPDPNPDPHPHPHPHPHPRPHPHPHPNPKPNSNMNSNL
jgi:hypothetical protein